MDFDVTINIILIKKGIRPPMIREARSLSFGKTKAAITHEAGTINIIKI